MTTNTTNLLLALLVALVALLTLVTVADLAQDSQPWSAQSPAGADRVAYAVHNPALQEELHARIMAPAIKEGTIR